MTLQDPDARAEAERLAAQLAKAYPGRIGLEQARALAEAKIALIRVRAVQQASWENIVAAMSGDAAGIQVGAESADGTVEQAKLSDLLANLFRLDRYARRATKRWESLLKATFGLS